MTRDLREKVCDVSKSPIDKSSRSLRSLITFYFLQTGVGLSLSLYTCISVRIVEMEAEDDMEEMGMVWGGDSDHGFWAVVCTRCWIRLTIWA